MTFFISVVSNTVYDAMYMRILTIMLPTLNIQNVKQQTIENFKNDISNE